MPGMLQNDGLSFRRIQPDRYSSRAMTPLAKELAIALKNSSMRTALSAPMLDVLPLIPLYAELTLAEAISDPMIALINQADEVDVRSFAQLLQSASRVLYPSGRGTLAMRTDSLLRP